ncbi:MAG TPA: J domain-containing protein [Kofleriaceae bacterium]|nr:J domain-containing protein [Kofleriaceae bacterium]
MSATTTEPLGRGDFVRVVYRLGRAGATGVLTIYVPRMRNEVLVLRRGQMITSEADALGRGAAMRLARIASLDGASWSFDGGTAAYPPGAHGRVLSLARWARTHVESQLDATRADRLVHELAGVRIAVRADYAPDPTLCDETDRRILAAMAQPRRLDQIWPLARTPRFRLLAFIHFLRSVGALTMVGIAAERSGPHVDPRSAAHRLLGVDADADRDALKRAYRRMARALHPDLHQDLSVDRRRELEAKLAAVTAAYQQLI